MSNYLVVIERGEDGSYSAYVPDLPGCVSCGASVAEVKLLIHEAISIHLDSLRLHQEKIPESSAIALRVNA